MLAEDQQVRERRAVAKALRNQPIGFLLQQERSAGRQFLAKGLRGHIDRQRLPAEGVSRPIIQPVAYRKAGRRRRAGLDPAIFIAQPCDLADDQLFVHCILFEHTRLLDRRHKQLAAAVATGHFRFVDGHLAVVDLQTGKCGENVLDHLHPCLVTGQRRAPRHFYPIRHQRLNPRRLRQVSA